MHSGDLGPLGPGAGGTLCLKYPTLGPIWNQNGVPSHLVECPHYMNQFNFTVSLLLEGRKMGQVE